MDMKIVAKNKKALFDYEILDKVEAGIVLSGTEIKAVRAGKLNIRDSFVRINNNQEAFIINMHIGAYEHGNVFNHEETRQRKLLLHKKEIAQLAQEVQEKSLTIVPLQAYIKDNRLKVEIALARGKKNYDKREAQKQKDADREIEKALKNY
jgi:SsrA-binding protein